MKKTSVFLFALAILTSSIAQIQTNKASIKWGNDFKMKSLMNLDEVVSIDKSGSIVLIKEVKGIFRNNKYHITKVSNDLNHTGIKPLNLQVSGKELELSEIFELNDDIYIFSILVDKTKKTQTLYQHTLNRNNLAASSGKQIKALNYENASRRNTGSFAVIVSEDHSKILVLYYTPYKKGEPEQFGAILFDNDMEIIWENEYTLPYNDENFEINKVIIGNNGQLFLNGTKYTGNKTGFFLRNAKDYSFCILSTDTSGNNFTERPVELKDFYISDLTIGIIPNGDIICSGFTTSRANSTSINGVFYLIVDHQSGEVLIETTKPFDHEFIKEGMTEKQEKKTDKKVAKGKEVSLPNFVFRDIILKEQGGALVIAEQYWMVVVTTTDSKGVPQTIYHYYYNDIIVVSIGCHGQIEWASKIIKRQHSTDDNGFYSSYALAIVQDKLFFIYNDNIDNLLYPKEKMKNFVPRTSKKGVVALCEVDYLGNVTKEMLFSSKEVGLLLVPKLCEQTSENELFLNCKKSSKNKFGILTFK